jgi:hypothetical protein
MSNRKTTAVRTSQIHMPHTQSSNAFTRRHLRSSAAIWAAQNVGVDSMSAQTHGPAWVLVLTCTLLLGSFSTKVNALPPLVLAADIAQDELQVWWKPGDLMVGMPNESGRPAMRPLIDLQPRTLPKSAAGWTLFGEACPAPKQIDGVFCGHPVRAELTGDALHPKLRLLIDGRAVAENLLGRPAVVCSLHIGEADTVVGPELIVSWRPEKESTIRGLTVYRIPEALHPPCGSPPD